MIMEHSIAASSNCINGDYHMYKDHLLLHCKSTAEGGHENNIPLFHSNMHDASICVSEDGPVLHGHAGCTVDPFPREGHGMRASIHNRDDASSLHEPNVTHDKSNDETMRAHMPLVALTDASPQALLDIIVYAQKKLRQLQAIAETMVQVAGQAQQQQSLVAGMKSIMSQLHIAMAGVCTQPAPCSKQDLGSARSQLDRASNAQFSQALDLSFDNFHSYGMNISNLPPLGSILGAPSEGLFSASPCSELTQSTMELVHMRNASAPQLSAMMGPNLTSLAMERVCMRGLCGSKLSGIKHPQLQKQSLNSIVGDLVNHRRPSNASDVLAESESASIVMETLDSHGTHDNRNQEIFGLEDHDYASVFRDDDDDDVEGENLPPGSYELVEMAAAEILAEHTHFCEICGKGFKRDANLRMHMRGHGDEYKSPAALARPSKCLQGPAVKLRRYSCPYQGCKRNKKHRKFQPLKTTLCVKNHYRRTHCPKLLICSKCKTKRFSVVADLKTHEKHCGQDKWQCSCGTTFSRKDKLAGHVSLFAGHTPAVPMHEIESLDENLFDSLPAGDGKGAEGLPTSNPSNFGMVESFHALPENELTLTTTLMAKSDDGNGIPNVAIMGKEVLS